MSNEGQGHCAVILRREATKDLGQQSQAKIEILRLRLRMTGKSTDQNEGETIP